jgi:hypothetical protein
MDLVLVSSKSIEVQTKLQHLFSIKKGTRNVHPNLMQITSVLLFTASEPRLFSINGSPAVMLGKK